MRHKAQFTQYPHPPRLTNPVSGLAKRLFVTEAPLPQGKGDSDRSSIFTGGEHYWRQESAEDPRMTVNPNFSQFLKGQIDLTRLTQLSSAAW